MAPLLLTLVLAASTGRIPVPTAYEKRIAVHLDLIEANKWAEVTPGDLYHGHLLLKPGAPRQFASAEEMFSWSVGVLYHADEMLVRWWSRDGHLPPLKRRQRSLIGSWDGTVVTAVSLIAEPDGLLYYNARGTVYLDELARERPGLFDLRADRNVRTRQGSCLVDQIIDIGGIPRRMTMECYIR